mmetsp:Transcript_7065/g.30105  ORF Transcript_7065/g.30105 Transcript_7065/m.30105 type:complete len:201 (+) Transcript_7065:1815-2417(+)
MAIGVIDPLEVVQVQRNDGMALTPALQPLLLQHQGLVPGAAVQQPGQGVGVGEPLQLGLGLLQLALLAAQLQQGHGLLCQLFQPFDLPVGQPARNGVQHGQCADGLAAGRTQRHAAVHDVALLGAERKLAGAWVGPQVDDMQAFGTVDDQAAIGLVARLALPARQANARLGPDPVGGDEIEHGNRAAGQLAGQTHDQVEL